MRKIFIVILIVLFSSSSLVSQERVFHAGLLGGLTASQVLNDGFAHYSKLGAYGGGFLLVEFSDMWIGEVGMTYVMKGSKERQNNNGAYGGYKLTLGYLEFPFVVKFRMKKWDIELGTSLGILVNSDESNLYQDDIQSSTPFEGFEWAGLVGVNYSIDDKWGLNLRISNSIIPIRYPTDNVYYNWGQAQYNNVASFAVRYFVR